MKIKLFLLVLICIINLDSIAQPPLNPIEAKPNIGFAPLNVEFQFNIADVIDYSWDFGNGEISEDEKPSTTYKESGTYDLQVFVQYSDNSYDTLKLIDYVVVMDSSDIHIAETTGKNLIYQINRNVEFGK